LTALVHKDHHFTVCSLIVELLIKGSWRGDRLRKTFKEVLLIVLLWRLSVVASWSGQKIDVFL
jgi:hypothetical protein